MGEQGRLGPRVTPLPSTTAQLKAAFSNGDHVHHLAAKCNRLLQFIYQSVGLPRWERMVKNPPAKAADVRHGFHPWGRKVPWRRKWQPAPAFLPGASHGQRSLGGYSSKGCTESDTNEVT